jgi:hypothetical protein
MLYIQLKNLSNKILYPVSPRAWNELKTDCPWLESDFLSFETTDNRFVAIKIDAIHAIHYVCDEEDKSSQLFVHPPDIFVRFSDQSEFVDSFGPDFSRYQVWHDLCRDQNMKFIRLNLHNGNIFLARNSVVSIEFKLKQNRI